MQQLSQSPLTCMDKPRSAATAWNCTLRSPGHANEMMGFTQPPSTIMSPLAGCTATQHKHRAT